MNYKEEMQLKHMGVVGMRWGVSRGTIRRSEATRGAASIRKVGGAYADAMANKQKKIQSRADVRINDAKRGEALIRKVTEKYSGAMEQKAKRIDSILATKSSQKIAKVTKALNRDIDSFNPYVKTGIVDKHGKVMLTAKEVVGIQDATRKVRDLAVIKIKNKYGQ